MVNALFSLRHNPLLMGSQSDQYRCWAAVCLGLLLLCLVGCGTSAPVTSNTAAQASANNPTPEIEPWASLHAAPKPRSASRTHEEVLSWDEAIQAVAADLQGAFAASGEEPAPWVAEPFVNGLTGAQSMATRHMTDRVAAWWRAQVPQAEPWPFTPQAVAKARWWLMGSITPAELNRQHQAPLPTWRLCVALADVQSGVVIAKAVAFATPDGIRTEPSAFFRDAPMSINDTAAATLDRRCQGLRPGEVLPSSYLARITASPTINLGIESYDRGAPAQALRQFESALEKPAGHQFRAYTGMYLSQVKLGQRQAASKSFRTLVDHGVDQGDFGLQLTFRTGATSLWNRGSRAIEGEQLMAVADVLSKRLVCAEIEVSAAHTMASDKRLALQRAEAVQRQMVQSHPVLDKRLRPAEHKPSPNEPAQRIKPSKTAAPETRTVQFRTIDCY